MLQRFGVGAGGFVGKIPVDDVVRVGEDAVVVGEDEEVTVQRYIACIVVEVECQRYHPVRQEIGFRVFDGFRHCRAAGTVRARSFCHQRAAVVPVFVPCDVAFFHDYLHGIFGPCYLGAFEVILHGIHRIDARFRKDIGHGAELAESFASLDACLETVGILFLFHAVDNLLYMEGHFVEHVNDILVCVQFVDRAAHFNRDGVLRLYLGIRLAVGRYRVHTRFRPAKLVAYAAHALVAEIPCFGDVFAGTRCDGECHLLVYLDLGFVAGDGIGHLRLADGHGDRIRSL